MSINSKAQSLMRLREIQENFKDTILEPETLDENDSVFRHTIKSDTGISVENRMKVYRNNVISSLTDAIMATLPMTTKLVGEDFLKTAARLFVADNLPTEGNLNTYGNGFCDFINQYEPAKKITYLYDMVKLEYAWEQAYYAADDHALAPYDLVQIPESELPDLQLRFRDSFKLIESHHPLDEIIDYCRSEGSDTISQLSPRGAKIMIYRPKLTVEIRRLNDDEYTFLKSLQEGKTLHETAETILTATPDADFAALLQKFLRQGIFKSFS